MLLNQGVTFFPHVFYFISMRVNVGVQVSATVWVFCVCVCVCVSVRQIMHKYVSYMCLACA